jgi:uncharacterized protein YkwD
MGCGSEEKSTRTQHVMSPEEFRVFQLTNQVRVGESLQPLVVNQELCVAARAHADKMAEVKAAKSPNQPEMESELARVGYRFSDWGVNVAQSRKSPEDAFAGVMKQGSSKMRVLQTRYEDVGVGIARGDDNAVYLVQVFGAKRKQ